jgi:FlaG protein
MDVSIGKLTQIASAHPPVRQAPATTPEAVFSLPAVDTVEFGVPPEPPREVLDEVDKAADRAHQLAADNRELHFEMDEKSKRVIIQVRDLDGKVIRTIPPSQALSMMSGEQG